VLILNTSLEGLGKTSKLAVIRQTKVDQIPLM